jgi:hypothetical protein
MTRVQSKSPPPPGVKKRVLLLSLFNDTISGAWRVGCSSNERVIVTRARETFKRNSLGLFLGTILAFIFRD